MQVSVPAEMEVLLGEKVSILCTHMLPEDDPLVEWFIVSAWNSGRKTTGGGGGCAPRGHVFRPLQ